MDGGQQIGFAGLRACGTNIVPALSAAAELEASPPPAAPTPPAPSAADPIPVQDREPGLLGAVPLGVRRFLALAAGIALIVGVKACLVSNRSTPVSGSSAAPYSATGPYDIPSASDDAGAGSDYNATIVAPSPTDNRTMGSEDPSVSIPDTMQPDRQPDPDTSDEGSQADQPPLGSTGQTFTTAQVRYCLEEQVRVGAARRRMEVMPQDPISAYNRGVRNFNEAVRNYNSRCSSYYSSDSSMAAAQASVDAARSRLEAEGEELLR